MYHGNAGLWYFSMCKECDEARDFISAIMLAALTFVLHHEHIQTLACVRFETCHLPSEFKCLVPSLTNITHDVGQL